MNKLWIRDSHTSAKSFKNRPLETLEFNEMRLVRILDVAGMFETSWLVYNHSHNTKYGYGCPK